MRYNEYDQYDHSRARECLGLALGFLMNYDELWSSNRVPFRIHRRTARRLRWKKCRPGAWDSEQWLSPHRIISTYRHIDISTYRHGMSQAAKHEMKKDLLFKNVKTIYQRNCSALYVYFLNMFCSFVLLQAFSWNALFFSFIETADFFYNFFPLPRTIIYDNMIWFLSRNVPVQKLSHLMWWNLFRFVLLRNHHMWCGFFSVIFLFRNFHIWCEVCSDLFLFRNDHIWCDSCSEIVLFRHFHISC